MKNLLQIIKTYKMATLNIVIAMIFIGSYYFTGDKLDLTHAALFLTLSTISVLTVRIEALEDKVK